MQTTQQEPAGRSRVAGQADSITDRAELNRRAPEIAALLDRAGAPVTARWAALGARLAMQPDLTPWVTTIRRDDRLVGAALLARRRVGPGRGLGSVITSMNEPHLPGCLPALDAAAATDLAAAVAANLAAVAHPWRLDVHMLGGTDPVSRTAGNGEAELGPLVARLAHCELEVAARSPRLVFEPDAALNDYLSRNTRSARAKARNRIARAGLTMQLTWHRRPADIERQLADVVEVCRARDRHSGQHRKLDAPGPRAMFVDQIRAYAADGRARLLTLRLGDALAAFALCLDNGTLLYVHSNRAAPDWMEFSPGLIVNAEVVEHAWADRSLSGVDWGGSPQRYKLSGGAHLHDYVSLHAWSGPGVRGLDSGLRAARRQAVALRHGGRSALSALRARGADHQRG